MSKEKSDDEEESRAGAIKKKARVVPFGEGKKAKKKKKVTEVVVPLATPDTEKSEQDEVIEMIVEDVEEGTSLAPSTPQRKKRKRKSSAEDLIADGLPVQALREVTEQSAYFKKIILLWSLDILDSHTVIPQNTQSCGYFIDRDPNHFFPVPTITPL